MLGTLSRYRRQSARVLRYSVLDASGWGFLVFSGWKVQGMKAVNPPVPS